MTFNFYLFPFYANIYTLHCRRFTHRRSWRTLNTWDWSSFNSFYIHNLREKSVNELKCQFIGVIIVLFLSEVTPGREDRRCQAIQEVPRDQRGLQARQAHGHLSRHHGPEKSHAVMQLRATSHRFISFLRYSRG